MTIAFYDIECATCIALRICRSWRTETAGLDVSLADLRDRVSPVVGAELADPATGTGQGQAGSISRLPDSKLTGEAVNGGGRLSTATDSPKLGTCSSGPLRTTLEDQNGTTD